MNSYNVLEDVKIIKRIEKTEELCGYYLKMAKNNKKSTSAENIRLNMEEEILDNIIGAITSIQDILENAPEENVEEGVNEVGRGQDA